MNFIRRNVVKNQKLTNEALKEKQKQEAEVLSVLHNLIDAAESKSLWLYTSYKSMWFSPNELRQEIAKGQYLWAYGWTCRDPNEYLIAITKSINNLTAEKESFIKRIENEKLQKEQK